MKLILFFIACCLFAHAQTFAQGDEYIKGYVVTGGDTLRGYLGNTSDPWNCKALIFKKSRRGNEKSRFTLKDVSSFYFESSDELFVKKPADIDKSPAELSQLQEFPRIMIQRDTVFLQKLVGGELNLFLYYDFKRHFFVEKQNELTELLLIKYINTEEGVRKVFRQEKYKEQLSKLLRGCSRPAKFYFDSDSLSKNVRISNLCASRLTYLHKREKIKFSFGILGGSGTSTFSYSGEANGDQSQALYQAKSRSFGNQQHGTFGAFVDVFLKQRSSFSLNGEFIYRPSNYFSSSNNVTYRYDTRMDYTVNLQFSTVNLGIKYKFLRSKGFSLSLKANVALALISKNENYQIQTNNLTQSKVDPLATFGKTGYGYASGIQANFNPFFLQLRHDQILIHASNPSSATISIGTTSLVAGIKIK